MSELYIYQNVRCNDKNKNCPGIKDLQLIHRNMYKDRSRRSRCASSYSDLKATYKCDFSNNTHRHPLSLHGCDHSIGTRWCMKTTDIKAGRTGLARSEFPSNASAVDQIHDILRRKDIYIDKSPGSNISEFVLRYYRIPKAIQSP